MTLRELVRSTRLQRGLSVAALAKSSGVSESAIKGIERGDEGRTHREDTLQGLADALGVEVEGCQPAGPPIVVDYLACLDD